MCVESHKVALFEICLSSSLHLSPFLQEKVVFLKEISCRFPTSLSKISRLGRYYIRCDITVDTAGSTVSICKVLENRQR